MTAKEKAKAYDEALERAKDCLTNKKFKDIDDTPESLTTYIFPELCESEDEKIRKELLSFIESVQHNYLCATDRREKWIAYLEKQKEQKAYVNTDYFKSFMLQYLQDATNKKDDSEIEAATNYWMEKLLGLTKWQKEQKTDCLHPEDYPMTPEECTKPAEWSEEDAHNLSRFIEKRAKEYEFNLPNRGYDIFGFAKDILKYLRINHEKVEWSEEDINASVKSYSDSLPIGGEFQSYHNALVHAYRQGIVNALKSSRSQPRWKPSEEQMNGLAHAINIDVYDAKRYALDSLYNNLKKLM